MLAQERYSAFGVQERHALPATTDQLYTGQRLNTIVGLYHYSDGTSAGRFYDPLLGRFVQPDPLRVGTGSQALNPYSYSFNNPVKYVDPDGHDPLDQQWRDDFAAEHGGRAPDARDEQIRLFSLAYYNEWDPSYFYNPDGTVNEANMRTRFQNPADTRSWDTMGNALLELSRFYLENEQAQFIRDIGFLYAGLPVDPRTLVYFHTGMEPLLVICICLYGRAQ